MESTYRRPHPEARRLQNDQMLPSETELCRRLPTRPGVKIPPSGRALHRVRQGGFKRRRSSNEVATLPDRKKRGLDGWMITTRMWNSARGPNLRTISWIRWKGFVTGTALKYRHHLRSTHDVYLHQASTPQVGEGMLRRRRHHLYALTCWTSLTLASTTSKAFSSIAIVRQSS